MSLKELQVSLSPKKVVLWLYVLVSIVFIVYTLFVGFRDGVLRNAYEAGRSDTVNALIGKATDGKCEAVNIFSGDKKVDLINVECLQKSPDAAAAPGAAPAGTK
jgi:hypothetical protein